MNSMSREGSAAWLAAVAAVASAVAVVWLGIFSIRSADRAANAAQSAARSAEVANEIASDARTQNERLAAPGAVLGVKKMLFQGHPEYGDWGPGLVLEVDTAGPSPLNVVRAYCEDSKSANTNYFFKNYSGKSYPIAGIASGSSGKFRLDKGAIAEFFADNPNGTITLYVKAYNLAAGNDYVAGRVVFASKETGSNSGHPWDLGKGRILDLFQLTFTPEHE